MKEKCKILLCATMMLSLLTGCKGQQTNTNNVETVNPTDVEVTESMDEKTVDTKEEETPVLSEEEQIRQDMIERSLLAEGNNDRMKKVIEKARNGEDITIAYIGGSITEGYNAGTQEIYAKLSCDYFRDTYAAGNVNYVNAGLSGTPSLLGLIRSDRDVFSYEPDLVFIEFAVNDGQSVQDSSAYESLVRKALMQEQEPAVVLLFSVIESGYTCQNTMQVIGFNYQLPMISVKAALDPEFESGRMTWKDWSNDESHPNAFGHQLYSEFITYYWNVIDAEEPSEEYIIRDQMVNMDFTEMTMLDKESLTVESLGSFHEEEGHTAFQNGWVKSASEESNESFVFEITCKSLFFVYKEVNSQEYGSAEIYVDGERMITLTANAADGWNNPVAERIFRDSESKIRKVEVKMKDGDEDKAFALLAIAYCP